MVRIRLQRFGRTHRPFYRIAAMDSRTRRNGKVIENLGWYNPVEQAPERQIELKEERIRHWLSQGAIPTETMRDLLAKHDLLTPKLKAEWEADQAKYKARGEAKAAEAKKKAEEEAAAAAAAEAEAKAKADAEAKAAADAAASGEATEG